jgi:hypothetical protein
MIGTFLFSLAISARRRSGDNVVVENAFDK